jgi:ClpP class serine protease
MLLLAADLERYFDRISRAGAINAESQAQFAAERGMDNSYLMAGPDAIIAVSGPISYGYDIFSWLFGGSSYVGLQNQLKAAQANPDIKRIIMVFDTPGGAVTGCNETARMIKSSTKPVDAVVNPECASAGLWLASQCRTITCMESGEIGSLGVQSILRSYHRQLKEAGVDMNVIRAAISPDKNLGHPMEEISESATADRQSRADKWGEVFLAAVASGRGVSRDVAYEKFGKGKMMFADEALAAGLIDRIGTLETVLSDREPAKRGQKPSARYAALRDRD